MASFVRRSPDRDKRSVCSDENRDSRERHSIGLAPVRRRATAKSVAPSRFSLPYTRYHSYRPQYAEPPPPSSTAFLDTIKDKSLACRLSRHRQQTRNPHLYVRQCPARYPKCKFHLSRPLYWAQCGEMPLCQVHTPLLGRHTGAGMRRVPIGRRLVIAIDCFVAATKLDPRPLVLTANPRRVLAAFKRGKQALKSNR